MKLGLALRRGFEILRALTIAEFRETREFTLLGIARWIFEPVIYMGIYFVFVAAVLNRPRSAYPLFLLCALVPFRYFTSVTNESMMLFKRYADIIQNRSFPRAVLPSVLLCVEGAPFLVAMCLLTPLMVFYRVDVGWSLLWFPLILLNLVLVSAGPTYLGTIFGLYFPDFRGVIQNLLRITFFVSSGLVPLGEIPGDRLPDLFRMNPLSGVFDSFRAVMLDGVSPSAFDLTYPFAFGVVVGALGLAAFRARRYEYPKEVY